MLFESGSVRLKQNSITKFRLNTMRLTVIFSLIFSASLASAQPEEKLPTLEVLETPSVETLLTQKPVDWIILNTDEVLIVESVSPRPDTVNRRLAEIEEKKKLRNQSTGDERTRIQNEMNELERLVVIIPDEQGSPEFKLPLNQIKGIIHHEDHMLKRIDLLLEEKNVSKAMELIDNLQKAWDIWPGMIETYRDIIFVDAKNRIEAGKPELALVVMDELYDSDKDYRGLSELFGETIKTLVEESLKDENYLRAQFFLNRVNQRYKDHPLYQKYNAELTAKVNETLQQANASAANQDFQTASVLAEKAALIWPKAPNITATHRAHVERYQRLHVGVVDQPGTTRAYEVAAPADERVDRLTQIPLFEIEGLRDGTAYYRTRFFDEWEPLDLGREMRFTLKQYRQPYEMQSVVTTTDVVTPILDMLDPDNPAYSERHAAYIDSIVIESPTAFRLVFKRVPPRIEPLLSTITIVPRPGDESAIGPLTEPGGFQLSGKSETELVFTRKIPEPDNLPKYHVAEIVEHKYQTHEKAVQGLIRGEVAMLPDVPDWILRRMLNDDEFMKRYFVLPYAVPLTHLLQFNPASKSLRVRELRRGLAYAVDRERILKEIVLRDETSLHGRIVTAPFVSSSPGRNVLVKPRRFDLSAGVAMSMVARKQNKDAMQPITMIVAPGPVEVEAAKDIANTWRRIGFEVNVVLATDEKPASWDILYRTTQMTEPLVEIWPFLAFSDRAKLSDLDHYPDWLKQELVELDRTSDQSRAITGLQQLHQHLWSDTSVVPLYEVDKYMVLRKNLQGFPTRPMHCYDKVDRLIIDAWYQTELP